MGRRFDLAGCGSTPQIFGRDIGPVFSFIARIWIRPSSVPTHSNPLVIGDSASAKIGVVVLGTRIVQGDFTPGNILLGLVIARQVRTDCLPMRATVRGLEQAFARVIQRVGIVRRNQNGRGPLETVFQVAGSVSIGKLRLLVIDFTVRYACRSA